MKRAKYDEVLEGLTLELVAMARWAKEKGKRILVLIEGRDTAGKGGVIDALSGSLNPRQCRIVALAKPSDVEATQWYLQRYIEHLPAAGEIVLFDRSWYNRAGVERVMGFCTEAQAGAFLDAVPLFEQQLVDDGILLFKYWLTCDQEQQEERFSARLADPLKQWKLSPIDVAARHRYEDYTRARETMLQATHTKLAPWTLVDFNDQKHGRLTLIRDLLDRLPETKVDATVPVFEPLTGAPAKEHFGVVEPIALWPKKSKS